MGPLRLFCANDKDLREDNFHIDGGTVPVKLFAHNSNFSKLLNVLKSPNRKVRINSVKTKWRIV